MRNITLLTFLIYLLSNPVHGKEINIQFIQSCNNHTEQLTSKDSFMYNNMLSNVNKEIGLLYLENMKKWI